MTGSMEPAATMAGGSGWISFFRRAGHRESSGADGFEIDRLFREDKEKIDQFGRGTQSALLIYQLA
jgi:hypothetical protein